MKKFATKLSSIICAAVLALTPMSAFADTEERATTTKDITWMEGETEPTVPETITVDGVEWALQSVTEAQEDSTFKPETKTVTKTDEGTYADLAAAKAAYPESIAYEEDGFAGTLTRTQFDYEGLYSSTDKAYDVTLTHGPYKTNDSTNVPKSTTVTYTDAQGAHTATIPCVKYEWTVTSRDARGFITGYSVVCTYRGVITVSEDAGCSVKVGYEGEVVSTAKRMVKTATYAAPEASSGMAKLVKAAVAAVAATAGVSTGLFFFFRRRRNVTVRDLDDTKTIAKVRGARTSDKTLVIALPAKLDLAEGALLYLDDELADGGDVIVMQAGEEVWKGMASQTIKLIPPVAE